MRTTWQASACLVAAAASTAAVAAPPETPRRPVTDTYWGAQVADDYRYLEDLAGAETLRFAQQQNQQARQWLDARPERAAILNRVVELTHDQSPDFYALRFAGGRLFAMKRQPPSEQPMLVVFPPGRELTGERTLVDPNATDAGGSTSIDFYVPSLDGARVAVSMSSAGTEAGTLTIYDVATGSKLPDSISRVNGGTAGGSAAWAADGNALYYTRYPRPGERPDEDLPFYQQVWYHVLGAPDSQDGYVLGREFPRIAEIELSTSVDGRYLLAEVGNGDGGEYAYWLKGPDLDWTRVADFKDLVIHAEIGPDGWLYLLSRNAAPHMKILRVPCKSPVLSRAEVAVPEGRAVIRSYVPAAKRLYVIEMVGGPTHLRVCDLAAGTSTVLGADEPATLGDLVRLEEDEILLRRQSYLTPPEVVRYAPGLAGFERTPLVHESPADFSDCAVRRERAAADDGTKIPITVLMRRDTLLDGSAPLLLYGYGSYGMALSPSFSASRRLWVEQGGIYAVAHVRGGGEYGDEWHRAANLENKRITIDDFAAAARHLVQRGYTSTQRLAIEGGSAGGLLIYGVVVHHPQICRAAVAHVGIGDLLRVELSPNGQFNVTEFGSVRDERQFAGMYALSPYHHVADGTAYPAILATTGMNDPRVEPWQSFKMVARLQASGTPNPVLLRVSQSTGHGGGTGLSERDQLLADTYTFLFASLDIPYRP